MKYKIQDETVVFDDYFKIKEASILHDTFKGGQIQVKRKSFERGDSVAVLMYEKDTDSLLFTKQFRYPTVNNGDGWILEIPAGSMEEGDLPSERAQKEVSEELGYQLHELKLISTFFTSPGGSSERIFLFYAEVTSEDKTTMGGGLVSEKEDIALVKMALSEILKRGISQCFTDAKSLVAVQWFFLNKKADQN